jgi:hypothetical protein
VQSDFSLAADTVHQRAAEADIFGVDRSASILWMPADESHSLDILYFFYLAICAAARGPAIGKLGKKRSHWRVINLMTRDADAFQLCSGL